MGGHGAVRWSDFFNSGQKSDESVSVYINRCAREVMDCGFQCPKFSNNLSEYMFMRKVMVRLCDPVLKQEVFRRCDTFMGIDSVRGFCSSYEAAQRDAAKSVQERRVAGADVTGQESVVAAERQPPHAHKQTSDNATTNTHLCYNCGKKHVMDRKVCPTSNRKCD